MPHVLFASLIYKTPFFLWAISSVDINSTQDVWYSGREHRDQALIFYVPIVGNLSDTEINLNSSNFPW